MWRDRIEEWSAWMMMMVLALIWRLRKSVGALMMKKKTVMKMKVTLMTLKKKRILMKRVLKA